MLSAALIIAPITGSDAAEIRSFLRWQLIQIWQTQSKKHLKSVNANPVNRSSMRIWRIKSLNSPSILATRTALLIKRN